MLSCQDIALVGSATKNKKKYRSNRSPVYPLPECNPDQWLLKDINSNHKNEQCCSSIDGVTITNSTDNQNKEMDSLLDPCLYNIQIFQNVGENKDACTPLYYDKQLFSVALELFNRKGTQEAIHDGKKLVTKLYYWECKGKVNAGQQLCTNCRDVHKRRNYEDDYFIDVMERKQYRTILCRNCMSKLLQISVGSSKNDIIKTLKQVRKS